MSASPSRPNNVLVGLLRVTIPGIVLFAIVGVVSVTAIRYFQHRSVLRGFPAQPRLAARRSKRSTSTAPRTASGRWNWPTSCRCNCAICRRTIGNTPGTGYDGELGPVLSRAGGPLDIAVQYQFPVADEQSPSIGWTATSAGAPIWIDPSQELPAPTKVAAEELEQRRRVVLKYRRDYYSHDERHVAEYERVVGGLP